MKLSSVGLLGVDSSRTRAYLDALRTNDLVLEKSILLAPNPESAGSSFPAVPYFDNETPALESLHRMNVPTVELQTHQVNDRETIDAVRDAKLDVLIYSGPGGVIVGRELLNSGSRLLHVHPGVVPQYRGSTTVYYSLLNDGCCGASAIFLDEQIDCGPVLATREYPAPEDRKSIDYGYDPFIRADLLIHVLTRYAQTGSFLPPQQSTEFTQGAEFALDQETYFVMHPVLRHIAVLSRKHAAA